jgi:hypothetical protein
MTAGTWAVAIKGFMYYKDGDTPTFRERGEVFQLIGGLNDEKLIRHGFINSLGMEKPETVKCDLTGTEFISREFYEQHLNSEFNPNHPEHFEGVKNGLKRPEPIVKQLLARPPRPGLARHTAVPRV